MYFIALATDYDGTIAHDGVVSETTLAALKRLKESGRKLILVTGRELPDLKRVFPELDVFDKVVAENGALVHTPASEEQQTIAPEPSAELVDLLEEWGVSPLSVGRSIIATWEPHQTTVLEAIKELGLELEIIFNKGAVMVLPSGINKAAGLACALAELGLSPHNVVGVGDAENDHAFLRACGCSVAVANALPAVKDTADLVTAGMRGEGVEQLIEHLVARDHDLGFTRRDGIRLGTDDTGEVTLWPTDTVLIAGTSGIGKSTLATALTERFVELGFQFCVFDPEGDYGELEGAVQVGDGSNWPDISHAMQLLDKPDTNIVVNTLALDVGERPGFFADFLPELGRLRTRTARPHWLLVDEVHHLLPQERDDTRQVVSMELPGSLLITVHPKQVAADVLRLVSAVVALGPKADEVIEAFCESAGIEPPGDLTPPTDESVLFWRPGSKTAPRLVKADRPKQSRKRHTRKYAEGRLDEAGSFYFRGPEDAMQLRAHNLMMFVQIGEGIDAATWEHHLRRGDYSDWFRRQIRDNELADETAQVENDRSLPIEETRNRVLDAVRRRYTAPATAA
jgi:HAD superfamily hydrolase (TIGR01484 family)